MTNKRLFIQLYNYMTGVRYMYRRDVFIKVRFYQRE